MKGEHMGSSFRASVRVSLLALVFLLPASAAAKPPKLEAWKGDDGRAFSKPVGWTVMEGDSWAYVRDPQGSAVIGIFGVSSETTKVFLEGVLPDAEKKTVSGWTCVEGTSRKQQVAACGRNPSDKAPVVHAWLMASPRDYEALGGMTLLLDVLDTVEGYPVDTSASASSAPQGTASSTSGRSGELEAWNASDGRAFSKPVGWIVRDRQHWIMVRDPDDEKTWIEIFVLSNQDDSAADWVSQDHPKAPHKLVDGWTCGEGKIETKKVATCGRDPEDGMPHFIRARLIAPPKRYKGLGGVKLLVQVLNTVEGFPVETEETGDPEAGGIVGGVVGDVEGAPPAPPKEAAPAAQKHRNISERDLESRRTAGSRTLSTEVIEKEIAGKKVSPLSVKVCIDEKGTTSSTQILRPTKFKTLNEMILGEIAKWSFKPHEVDGVAVAACAIYVFRESSPRTIGVTPKEFESLRVAGSGTVSPTEDIKKAMNAAGAASISVPLKVCVDEKGAVSSIQVIRGSGIDALDALIVKTITAWSFKPYTVNGVPVVVCGAHIFKVSSK